MQSQECMWQKVISCYNLLLNYNLKEFNFCTIAASVKLQNIQQDNINYYINTHHSPRITQLRSSR